MSNTFKFTKNPVGNINAILNKAKKEIPNLRVERTKTDEEVSQSGYIFPKRIIWKIWTSESNTSLDIGYIYASEAKKSGHYFFKNSNANTDEIGSVWNHTSKHGVGPEGHYSFDESEIVDDLKGILNLAKNK